MPTTSTRTQRRLGDYSTDYRMLILSAMAIVAGTGGAFSAWALLKLIYLATNLFWYANFSFVHTPFSSRAWLLVLLIPVIGGLIVGLMARFGSDKIRGHGIPEAIETILFGDSKLSPKVAILKPISSAVSIGSGGPFGAEGPIIMTGGAFGSMIAQFFHLTSAERKTLLVAGAAGGMAATFASPLAALL
ncbi:MAG: chloride channel protein, partial [Sphingomicrobium sp.]